MALADIDGDGDLDLYVVNNKVTTVQDLFPPEVLQPSNIYRRVGGGFEVLPEFREHYRLGEVEGNRVPRLELAEPDRLYLNDGEGRFAPVPLTAGAFLDDTGQPLVEEPLEWGLTARFQDMDGDGDPDLYVCNDFHSPDHVWVNDGTGRFRPLDQLAMRSTSFASMGIDFSDVDRDGHMDFFVVEMLSRGHERRMRQLGGGPPDLPAPGGLTSRPQKPRNTLYLNRGDGTYAEVAEYAGIEASEWSWGSLFVDVDLDGYEDLLIGNGHFFDAMDKDAARRTNSVDWRRRITVFPPLRTRNVAFRNRGDLTFEEVGEAWGVAGEEDISHGMASADLDNDGDLDIVINRLLAPAGIFRNEGRSARVAVRLRGLAPNTRGIGAKVRLVGGPVRVQSKEMVAGGSYLSGSDVLASFAAGDGDMTIEVTWRSGAVTRIDGVQPDRVYEISEAGAAASGDPATIAAQPGSDGPPHFEDVSSRLGHVHVENLFDDFARQPLMPVRLSQGGPGVAWHDMDGDGEVDLLIGGAAGAGLSYFKNDGSGGFAAVRDGVLGSPSDGDQTGVLVLPAGAASSIVVGTATYDGSNLDAPSASVWRSVGGQARASQPLPPALASTGPLATADYDGDGDLDLFVGGRVIPGQYPAPASSRLFLNDGNGFVLDEANSGPLAQVGMVSGAVFSDIDGDGDPDLLLAVEWGPIRLFRNQDGLFEDTSPNLGLWQHTGWWSGITTGDLNEDGLLDIIASNRGLNTRFEASREHPATVFHGDLDNDGSWDVIEARYDEDMRAVVPVRALLTLGSGLPFLRGRIQGFAHYAQLTLQEILGQPIDVLAKVEATTLAHTVFLNRGDTFEPVELPREAQLAPGFDVGVADLDGDGHEDVFMSQNLFAVRSEVNRDDAGRGLWLRGDGTGHLEPVPGSRSGLEIHGEQRGAAFADYDRDGRVDLVVTQNGAETKLYRNTGARPGLRVRLAGPAGNPAGIGAAIRLRYGDSWGPLREIHRGSGYWSQDDVVQVMGMTGEPTAVWVRWPGGSETVTPLPAGTPLAEVTIDASGELAPRP